MIIIFYLIYINVIISFSFNKIIVFTYYISYPTLMSISVSYEFCKASFWWFVVGPGRKDDSALGKYGKDLTELAKAGKLDPVIGRDNEIRRCIQILSRRTKNNPVIIGEPGVGKTAISEGYDSNLVFLSLLSLHVFWISFLLTVPYTIFSYYYLGEPNHILCERV